MKWVLISIAVLAGLILIVVVVGAMLPREHLVSRSARFKRPPQEVWDAVSGPATWRSDVTGVEPLPSRDGHRVWKELDRHGGGITYECMEERAPSRLITRIADPKLPFGGTWTQEIAPDAGGSILTITEAGFVSNPIFRFVSRFVIGHTATIDTYFKSLHRKFGEPED